MTAPARYLQTRRETAAVVTAAILGLVVLWAFRFRGWYPHDEGTLGQAAERILRGQIPHRDFDDPYTGGLAYLHALIFRLGGVTLNAIRSHLALVATVWFGGVFWLLTHWLRPMGAAVVAALIAVFSVPLYPAAMPSWYVLFLACGSGAVLTLLSHRRSGTLVVAGAIIGLAALAKVTALFAFAGAVWAIVAMRQDEDRERRGSVEIVLGAVIFSVMVMRLMSSLLDWRVFFHLALPPIAVVVGIAWREIRQGRARGFGFDLALWRRVATLALGAAIPVAMYALWLARNDALSPLVASLHAVVGRRSASASLPPPSVTSILYAVPLLAILLGASTRWRMRPFFLAAAGLTFGVMAWFYPGIHQDFWNALRGLLPAGAVLSCIVWPRAGTATDSMSRRALIVFVPLAGVMVLGQYPFAAPIYFLYVLPLLLLGLSAAVAARPVSTQRSAGIVALVYLLFGLIEVIPGSPDSLAMSADHAPQLAWLDLPRGHLLVPPDDAELYRELVATLDSLPPGPIWAGPDAPEVAFLSGRVDLNRSFFAFLGGDVAPGPGFAAQMAATGAQAVVADTAPSFSTMLTPETLDSISRYFPQLRTVDRFRIHSRGKGP
jgi:hypothetical protein